MDWGLTRLVDQIVPRGEVHDEDTKRHGLFAMLLTSNPRYKLTLLALGLVYGVLGLCAPLLQKWAMDELVAQDPDLARVVTLFFLSFLILTAASFSNLVVRMVGAREGVRLVKQLSFWVYQQALSLRSEENVNQTVGETVALLASHMQMVLFFMTDVFPAIFVSLLPLLIVPFWLTYFFGTNPVIVCIVILFFLFVCGLLAIRSSSLFQQYKRYEAGRLGVINEWIQNIRALKALGWVPSFERKIERFGDLELRQRYRMVLNVGVMNSLSGITPYFLSIAGVVSLLYFKEGFSAGDVFGVLWVLGAFLISPLRITPWIVVIGLDAATSLRRIEEYLQKPYQPLSTGESEPAPTGDLVVKGLSLSYGDRKVLDGIDISFAEGAFVAIVGPIGAGKSQLLMSLMGETPCQMAAIQLGQRDLDKDQLRGLGLFGYVPQEPFAMSGALWENVLFEYGSELVDRKGVAASLARVAFEADLRNMPNGIDTELGERGVNLSGGQKQRLSLSRADYLDRPFLLMDDTLSALDEDTERFVSEELLLAKWRHKTRVLVTHRLSVLPAADHVIFMDRGRVLCQGSYDAVKDNRRFQEFVAKTTESQDD